MPRLLNINDYINGLQNRDIAILSRAITLIESQNIKHQQLATQLIDAILPLTGNSMRVGITGVPGVGKSTFIETFGMHLIAAGKRVAVLAIDPSSSKSKGSILGDKTRMEELSVNVNAFVRPSASSGSLGGVTYKTKEAMLLCEAAGFDTIIVETVGVGQSETEVSEVTDFFLLLMLAGAGDELQGIKKGIMEMADGLIITKADGSNIDKAKSARTEYARALHFFPPQDSGWIPEVKISSAYNKTGISEVIEMIDRFKLHQISNGYFQLRRNRQNLHAFDRLFNEQLRILYLRNPSLQNKVKELKQAIGDNKLSPYSAVQKIMLEL